MKIRIGLAALLGLALVCAGFLWSRRPAILNESDSLLVGDLENASGEHEFDGALREALQVALAQSPHLNLVSDGKIRASLQKIGRSPGAVLDKVVLKMLCPRVGAQAFLLGDVHRTSDAYTITLQAFRCSDGSVFAQTEEHTQSRDLIIHRLGVAAAALRLKLGESKESIAKLNCPLERATTPIPAALRTYVDARRAVVEKGDLDSVPLYKKAIELDSRFALARSGLAVSYYNLNQMAQASEEIRLAYEAGDRQTLREHLNISTLYYDLAQGDVQKAIEGYKEYIRAYPRDDVAQGNLSSEFFVIGDYEQAAKYAEAALKLDPDSSAWYENESTALLALNRVEDADKVLKEAFARNLDDPPLHANLYSLAFLRGDKASMQRQLAWAAGKPNGEDTILAAQSDTEAYYGHLKSAREYTQRAVDSAKKADLPESAATWAVEAGLREAMFGNPKEARVDAEEALKLAPTSKDVRALAALVLARVGDTAKAQAILDDLRALYVSNMAIQKAWLPVVRAQMALEQKKYGDAITLLASVAPYEKGQLTGNLSDSCMIPAYLRGEAELGLQNGHNALKEFEKIESNPGIIGNCWSGPLSTLGEARAEAAGGSIPEAKISYQKFLKLWDHADPDLPVFKAAKSEAAKLH